MSEYQLTSAEIAAEIYQAINTAAPSTKTICLPCGYIHYWSANNRGNKYNTTIVLSSCMQRAGKSTDQQEVYGRVRVNFWKGRPFISLANAAKLAKGK